MCKVFSILERPGVSGFSWIIPSCGGKVSFALSWSRRIPEPAAGLREGAKATVAEPGSSGPGAEEEDQCKVSAQILTSRLRSPASCLLKGEQKRLRGRDTAPESSE